VGLDGYVLGVAALVSVLTGIFFGLAPALGAARSEVNETLREGRPSGTGSKQHRLRNSLVISEIALALVLLVGAGLMLNSLWRLQSVNAGFNPDGVLTMRLLLPFETYRQSPQRAAFYRQVLERVKALPGVAAVSAVSRIPMTPGNSSGTVTAEDSSRGAS